jgi:pilus assembly protein TadC
LLAALPDTTDMLSIVLGAGLSLDQAIARVADEIRFVYPELADEFYWMTLEVQAGQERAIAFQHMAQRTGLVDIGSLAGMIVQAERFGTGLSQRLDLKRSRELATSGRTSLPMLFFRFAGPLAQSVEHLPFKQGVAGSSPARLISPRIFTRVVREQHVVVNHKITYSL